MANMKLRVVSYADGTELIKNELGLVQVEEGKAVIYELYIDDSNYKLTKDLSIKLTYNSNSGGAYGEANSDDFKDGLPNTVTMPSGQTSVQFIINPIIDVEEERDELISISLDKKDQDSAGETIVYENTTHYLVIKDTAPNDLNKKEAIVTDEDETYVLSQANFGEGTILNVKIDSLPDDTYGKLVLDGEDVKAGQEISINDINSGKLKYIPAKDIHTDAINFEFSVNDLKSSIDVTVIAVADKPIAELYINERVEKIVFPSCDTENGSGGNGNNETLNPDFNKDDITINKGEYNNFIVKPDLDCGVTLTDKKILDKTNDLMTVNGGMKHHSVNFGGGVLNALEVEKGVDWGNIYGNKGDDTVIVGKDIERTTVNLGSGDNALKLGETLKLSTVHTYSGDDKVVVGKDVDHSTINVGGGTNYLEVGNNVNWSNLFGGAGNDTFVVDGSIDRTTVNLGAGKNSLNIGGELDLSTVHSGSFNDSVSVGRDVKKSTINLGGGKNSIEIDGHVTKSNLFTLSGDDVVNIKKDVSDTVVNLGFGHNEFTSNDFNRSSIHTYSGNDKVTINGDVKQGLINLGDGKNVLDVKGNTEKGTILTGVNKDTVVLEGDVSNTYVNTGFGDDRIFVGGKTTSTTIDGGAGQDTLYLPNDLNQYSFYDGLICKKPTTYEDFMAKNSGKYGISCHTFYIVDNLTGSTLTVRNIEFLEFNAKASDLISEDDNSNNNNNGGNNNTDVPVGAEYLYTYDIDLLAKLTDRDGSEKLTVRLEGLPSGVMIDDTRYTYDAVNGAYIVEVDGLEFKDTLTFQTYEKIDDTILNNIKLVAISKENSNESVAQTIVNRSEIEIERNESVADNAKASISVSEIESSGNLIGSFGLDIQNSGTGYTHSYTGKDVSCKIITTDKILKATDDYVLVEKNFKSSTINLGQGMNALDIKGDVDWGNIYAGKKDDTVVVDGEVKRTTVNLGFGDNSMKIGTNMELSTLHTYAGDDNLQIGNNLTNSTVNLGDGTNTIEIGNKVDWSNILALSGNDTVKVAGTIDHTTVNLGAGDNELYVGKNFQTSTLHTLGGDDTVWIKENLQGSTINLGNGANTLVVENKEGKTATATTSNSTITTGSGEDKVLIDGYIKNTNIFTGAGNDTIFVANGGEKCTMIDGGSGYDVLHLSKSKENYRFEVGIICKKPITWEEFMAQNKGLNGLNCKIFTIYELDSKGNLTGNKFEIRNIEEVQFNAKLSDFIELPTQDFKVDLSASLVDRDGSESLSVKITGIKDGWELEGNDCSLIKETDGSYTVTLPAGTKDYADSLILKTPEGTNPNDVKLTITAVSTEVRDDKTATTEVSSDGSMKLMGEAIDLGKIISENTKSISMENGKADNMKINLEEILDLDYREIEIKGDSNDTIQLGKDIWEVGKTNNGYTEYTGKGASSTVKLIIDNDIKIDDI